MAKITQLPTDTAPDGSDLIPFVDVSAARTEATTISNLAGSSAFDNLYAPSNEGRSAGPLTSVALTAVGTTPQVIDYFDGYLWGYTSIPGQIARSGDDGATWTNIATITSGSGVVLALRPTGDGEVLALRTDGVVASGIHKSSGWTTNPTTATWSQVLDVNGAGAAYTLPWGFDGYDNKWIVTHYAAAGSWADSRYVWISTDSGDTWSQVYDTGVDALSHNHAACYDRWDDRFLFAIGHDAGKGVYYSDDDGGTWTKVVDSDSLTASPTVIVATDNGYVCGSDADPNGIYGIERRDNPTDLRMRMLWQWNSGRDGLVGFAQRGFRDPTTGLVYIGFNSNFSTVSAVVAGGDAVAAAEVWRDPTPSLNGRMFNNVVTTSGKFVGDYVDSTGAEVVFTGWVSKPNATVADSSKVFGGTASDGLSSALGPLAVATGARSLAVGVSATSAANGTAVGAQASTGATDSVAVGYAANTGTGPTGVAVGASSTSLGEGVAVGASAVNTSTAAVAVGRSASAGNAATAVGKGATASASGADAIGYNAASAQANSIALGSQSVATAASQVKIGSRHIEFVEITEPAAGASNSARLYVKDNGAGKSQLCVRFASGAVQVIATEP